MMKAYRYILLLFCGLSAACTLDQGDIPPRKTQGENAIFSTVYAVNARAMYDLQIVTGFDLYLRQTTDAGRLAVVKSVFGWANIEEAESGVWTVDAPGIRCGFIIKDGVLLTEPGAEWQYYRSDDEPAQAALVAVLTTEQGSVRYKWAGVEDCSVDWLVDMAIAEGSFRAKATGSGGFEYRSDVLGSGWEVTYQIDKPLEWLMRGGMVKGELSVVAQLSRPEVRRIEFRAVCQPQGVRIITPAGLEEFWMD